MSRRALSANAGAPLIEPRMHCRRNSVGDQCEWPGYLPAAKHQIDSRVSSAPASSPAYLQRRPLHAAAGLPPPWPCSGPAAVLLRQSQRAGTGSAERLVLRDHALPVREGPYRRPRPVSWHEHLRGRAVRLDGDHAAGLVPRIPPGHRRRRVLVLDQGQAQGDGSKVEQAVLGLTALGNMSIELYADCTGSPVGSVIRDAAALAYDDPPS
jgi:hypothetical protein